MEVASNWFFDAVEGTALTDASGSPVLVERRGRAGEMPPLHRRDEDESYHVLEGELTFWVDDEAVPAPAGDVVVAPAGSVRTFRVESSDARWLVLTRVESLQRFEDFGRAMAEAADGARLSPEDRATLRAIGSVNSIEVLGPPGLVQQVV
jgi:mannose-6-phosphate isomerase-like protein (cupin superfamily)